MSTTEKTTPTTATTELPVQTLESLRGPELDTKDVCSYYIRDQPNEPEDLDTLRTCCKPNVIHRYNKHQYWCGVPERYFPPTLYPYVSNRTIEQWVDGNMTQCMRDAHPSHYVGSSTCHLARYSVRNEAASLIVASVPLYLLLLGGLWSFRLLLR
ncbi:hypothetical protein BDV39DRAFT_201889 [Aspergillus sergii]|uniref:Uncharacterized protein n=1 Tax=Aspergillus sergii TaxID=1034303 RepID=A0A5N6XB44_9EURO|nr:hypothetical protein BDV39DRAFT_201889 [Aspergillus sergii]